MLSKNEYKYKIFAEKLAERCQSVQVENERLCFRINKIKKLARRRTRDIILLKRRLDKHNDNWRSVPINIPHPKRKLEQKRGPKPKPKNTGGQQQDQAGTGDGSQNTLAPPLPPPPVKEKKPRKPRTKKDPSQDGKTSQQPTVPAGNVSVIKTMTVMTSGKLVPQSSSPSPQQQQPQQQQQQQQKPLPQHQPDAQGRLQKSATRPTVVMHPPPQQVVLQPIKMNITPGT